jgi:flagellar M-ring protein FliF
MNLGDGFKQIRKIFEDLSPGKRITLLALIGGTLIGLIVMTAWTSGHDYQTLYSNLEQEDAGAILEKLKEKKIPYRIAANGSAIQVPKEQVQEVRMELASLGLPQGSGVGFEIFDNTKLGMTEFVQNVNYQRALQGELSRTINRFEEVESSRVHIVMAERSLFVESEKQATASVVLKLRRGKWLGKGQVQGIVHLVSSSISGLKPENVTVVDSSGKVLSGYTDKSIIGKANVEQLEYKDKLERNLENRVKSMLETALGPDKAIVRLTASLDFKRSEKTEELYLPKNQVVRSEQVLSIAADDKEKKPQGIPGVVSNMTDRGKGSTKKGLDQDFLKQDRTVNYEIGKVTSHTIEPVGKLTRISVAVVVDGNYEVMEMGDGKKEWKYLPRPEEEMEKLSNIVKRAVNFDPKRGDQVEVINIPFESAKLKGMESPDSQGNVTTLLKDYAFLIKYTILGFFLFLAFMFIIKPLMKWLTAGSLGDMEMLKQLPKTVGELESEFSQKMRGLSYMKQAAQLVANNNDSSMKIMKDWLKES